MADAEFDNNSETRQERREPNCGRRRNVLPNPEKASLKSTATPPETHEREMTPHYIASVARQSQGGAS